MSGRHLASYLHDAASLWGERPACADATRTYSYNDYLNEALRVAALLRQLGVEAGDRVCISAPKSFSIYAGIFGTLMLNACYVPIDYTVPVARGRKIIADCLPAALITTRRNVERLLGSEPAVTERVSEDLVIAPIAARPRLPANGLSGLPPAPDSLDPASPAYILYTSGSTGEPKGVVHTHLSAAAFVDWAVGELEVDKDDIVAQVASVSFDLSVFDIFATVRAGALLAPIHESAMISPITLCRAVARANATVLYCVPSLVLREIKSHELGWAELERSSLRHIVFAGEPINHQALRRFRPYVAKPALHNWYGPTETNVCCYHRIAVPDIAGQESIPIGEGCPYAQLSYLWDTSSGSEAEAGELLVAGESLMTGYWNREEATARAMHRDASGTRFYRTGDFVRRDAQGDLVFLGRRDRQVKVQGRRIQLDEIESTLQKHFASAEIACTLIKEDGAEPFIVAAIAGGVETGTEDEVKRLVEDQLPLFMLPERIFALEALPRNERGKIDYDALARVLTAEYQRARLC
jgi:amino acid adenylation domain-containing protein